MLQQINRDLHFFTQGGSVKFDLLMPFWNPARWEWPFPELYQNLLDQIVRVEELGYENIWLTEYHFDTDG